MNKGKWLLIIGILHIYIISVYADVSSEPECQVGIYDGGVHRTLDCNNIFSLINTAGDVNYFLTYYDLTIARTSIPYMIYLQDEENSKELADGMFLYIKSFYEVQNRKPKGFAKSIMKNCLYQAIIEKPCNRNWLVAGWEFLKGEIVPRDTILGKHYLELVSGVPADLLEQYILPFWRDEVSENIYVQRHDSLVKKWGRRRSYHLTMAIENYGDTLAYKELIENDDDGKFIIYSIFMIDQYDYQPAYKDLLSSLIKYYEGRGKRPLGKKALIWLQELLMENKEYINDDIFKETTSAILSYSIQKKTIYY